MCNRWSIGRIALLVLIMLAPASAFGERREHIQLTSITRGHSAKITVELLFPDTAAEKVPVMLMVHGSNGVSAKREYAYAEEFLKMGIAAAVIDSFGGRGIRDTVRNQLQVTAHDMLVDATNTLTLLARHAAIDRNRIGMIGFSKGGTVVTKAALRRYIAPLTKGEAKFAVLIALYPWCGEFPLELRATDAPVYLLLGSDDTYVGIASCLEYARRVKELGGNVTVKTYAKAKHGWDVPGPAAWSISTGQNNSNCVYDEIKSDTWIERASKIKVMQDNKPTGDSVRTHCMTLGVSGGYNSEARRESMQDIRDILRKELRLN